MSDEAPRLEGPLPPAALDDPHLQPYAKNARRAEDLAATMLATILGVDFDPDTSYDERKDIWKVSDKIVTTRNVTQSAIGDRDGLWSSVVAAAVFVDLPNGK